MRGAAIVVVVCWGVACSDTIDVSPEDAGAADVGPTDLGEPYLFELDEVVEPLAPAPVVLTPCPSGWREVEGPSFTRCEPWPEEGRQQCADDAAHFPGGPGCTLLGTTCPLGQYAEQLMPPVLYVRSSTAAPSGDGTITFPFTRIASALAVAASGTTIALSKGVFDEALELRGGVTVRGACVAETRLTLSNAPVDSVLVTVRTPAALENLTLDARAIGVHVTGAGA